MSIITKMLKQTAVYWAKVSIDGYGMPVYDDPIEIKCRWEDTVEEFLDGQGELQLSRSKVYVDRDVEIGGVIMLGTLYGVIEGVDPKEQEEAWEIERFEKTPNLRASEFLRIVYL